MFKLEFIDIDNTNSIFEVKCDELRIITDVVEFTDVSMFNSTKYIDYTLHEENDLLSDDEIRFELMVLGDIDYDSFKRFIRKRNKSFLIRVTRLGRKPRMAICKHYNEKMSPIGTTDFYKWIFTLVRETRWIELSTLGFDLSEVSGGTSGYADSETFLDGYTYTDNFVYGESSQTIESFVVDLPENDGDKYAYMRVTINDANPGFSFGLDDNPLDTMSSYESDESLVILPNQKLIIDSYPPFKQINLITLPSQVLSNVQSLRNFEKRTYIRVPLGEHHIEFSGVRSGTIVLYKQYRMPW